MNQESSNATHINTDTNNNMTTTANAATNSSEQPSAAELGFRMPAEWEPHECCWMMWPSRKEMWSDINNTKQHYADVANAIGRFEPVSMLINAEDMDAARDLLTDNVTLVEAQIDDSWARDAGPNFLLNDKGDIAGSTWRFNAWGEKYSPFNNDDQVGHQVLTHCNAQNFVSELVAEGGGITVDGEGTVITTESCFLHTNRNPGWSKKEVEDELCRTLGAKKVIWLPGNVDETETDGHVDGVAEVVKLEEEGDSTRVTLRAPKELARFIAPKGSVALNGTSLTVNEVEGCDFGINFIPHTKEVTTWGDVELGDQINLEIDTLARYVARLQDAD